MLLLLWLGLGTQNSWFQLEKKKICVTNTSWNSLYVVFMLKLYIYFSSGYNFLLVNIAVITLWSASVEHEVFA